MTMTLAPLALVLLSLPCPCLVSFSSRLELSWGWVTVCHISVSVSVSVTSRKTRERVSLTTCLYASKAGIACCWFVFKFVFLYYFCLFFSESCGKPWWQSLPSLGRSIWLRQNGSILLIPISIPMTIRSGAATMECRVHGNPRSGYRYVLTAKLSSTLRRRIIDSSGKRPCGCIASHFRLSKLKLVLSTFCFGCCHATVLCADM